jgi:hypothetical protein
MNITEYANLLNLRGVCRDVRESGPIRAGMLGDVEMNRAAPTVRRQHSTKRTRKVVVGTVKKATETSSPTWLSRKAFQV